MPVGNCTAVQSRSTWTGIGGMSKVGSGVTAGASGAEEGQEVGLAGQAGSLSRGVLGGGGSCR